jgi:general secretion pathway protein C
MQEMKQSPMVDTRQISITSLIAIAVVSGLFGGVSVSIGLAHMRGRFLTPCVCPQPPAAVVPSPMHALPLYTPPPAPPASAQEAVPPLSPVDVPPPVYTKDTCPSTPHLVVRHRGGTFHISRRDYDQLLDDNSALATSARFVPSIRDGHPNGFKIYAVRPCSLIYQLGFRNADRIISVNGMDISTPDRALEAYARIKDLPQFTIQLVRLEQPMNLRIQIDP